MLLHQLCQGHTAASLLLTESWPVGLPAMQCVYVYMYKSINISTFVRIGVQAVTVVGDTVDPIPLDDTKAAWYKIM
jgi:hypothetical protein